MQLILLPGMHGTSDLFEPFVRAMHARNWRLEAGADQSAAFDSAATIDPAAALGRAAAPANAADTADSSLRQSVAATAPRDWVLSPIAYPSDHAWGYAPLIDHVLARLPPRGSFVLLGESFSGPIAVALAARLSASAASNRLCGLVLCGSFVRNPQPWARPLAPLLQPLLRRLRPPPHLAQLALFGAHGTPDLRQALAQTLRGQAPAVLAARLRAVADVDVSASWQALQDRPLPSLCLIAQHDRLVPERANRHMLGLRPDAQHLRLRGPHGLLQTEPEACAQAIDQFVRGLAQPAMH